ncbi:type I methionyl aminopeptidase [Brevibacterium sp. 91QC2O2]|uniref:type I methionyl aminopeptidase n=1 Tax=Brevibacterium TaxID=1696 RepID=UPI00211C2CE2|nr:MULTISPECIES: type I methionyl aminopeptidase [unclassified Brevibacterium]MCQ9366666.1 type I methionyl aminopeptidase [Brevibacterium sp. 91QC2O2]MCQ9384357.1 type I methionyl aminopeptidase [Brevibacterium sp. 68QC2CO]
MAKNTHVEKGTLSPHRRVPTSIDRPEYVGRPEPREGRTGDKHTPEEIEHIRSAGAIAANAIALAGRAIAPGVTTDELDRIAHEYICDMGGYPSCLGYRGFPKSICTSVNEVICHGIPDSTVLSDGDILNLDVTVFKDGVHGDTNFTFGVGTVAPEVKDLVAHTYEATMRGIKAVRPGRQVNVIGRVIEKYAKRFGYGVVRDFTGHGVGRDFHSGLVVPHYDAAPAHAEVIEPGTVFTVEPMLNLGTADWRQWDDDWTVVTADLLPSAQFEHTLVVTEDGPEILTLPTGEFADELTDFWK